MAQARAPDIRGCSPGPPDWGPSETFVRSTTLHGCRAARAGPPARLIAHKVALEAVRGKHARPVVLIGKSMGSRVGCHLSLTERVDAVICLEYPLVGGGKKRRSRRGPEGHDGAGDVRAEQSGPHVSSIACEK